MNDRGWLPTRADGEIWVGRGVASGASGRGRVYAHTVLLEQWSNGTRVCVWPRPHPGFFSEPRYLAGANAPSPTRPGCRARSSWLHVRPRPQGSLETQKKERGALSARRTSRRNDQIVSAHLHDTKPFSQVQVPAAANMLPDEADFPLGNDSPSARSVQRESVALLGLFPNYRDSGRKHQTFPFHMTSIRSVSCKSTMPHARRVLGSQAGEAPEGSRTVWMYT